jgi:microcystin-dependent protein
MGLSANPCAAGENPFLGEIETFAFTFCPVNWAPLNGQLLSISSNTALFALLGTTYGGDGITTFALPTGKPVFTLTPGAPMIQ